MSTATVEDPKKNAKQLKDEFEKAKKWCEKARDLLKIHQSGPRFDKDSTESKALDAARTDIVKSLELLKKKDKAKYEEFAKKFIELAKHGQKAKDENDKIQAQFLTYELANLNNEIKLADGQITPSQFATAQKVNEGGLLELYRKALGGGKERLKTITGFKAKNSKGHEFHKEAEAIIKAAELEAGAERYEAAIASLAKMPAEHQRQHTRMLASCEFERQLPEMKVYEQRLKIIDQMNGLTNAEGVTKVIHEAEMQFNLGEFAAALKKLEEVPGAYKLAAGKLSKNDIAKVEVFKKAKERFESKYREAQEMIFKNETIRGALGVGTVNNAFKEAERMLKSARTGADKAHSLAELQQAEQSLQPIPKLVETALKLAEEAKSDSEANLKAIPEYQKLLREAQNGNAIIRSLSGMESILKESTDLINSARLALVNKGDLTVGYPNAVEILKGHAALVERAQKEHEEKLKQDLPDSVVGALKECNKVMMEYGGIGPRFLAEIRLTELEKISEATRIKLANAGTDDGERQKVIAEAIQQLTTFKGSLVEENKKIRSSVQTTQKALVEARNELNKFVSQKPAPPKMMYAEAERLLNQAEGQDMVDHEWYRASNKIESARGLIDELVNLASQYGQEWLGVTTKLTEFQETGKRMLKWPPAASMAQTLIRDCILLEQQFAQTFDYKTCIDTFNDSDLTDRHNSLKEVSTSAPRDLEAVHEALSAANTQVLDASSQLTRDLWKLENLMVGVSDPRQTSLHTRLKDAVKRWDNYYLSVGPDSEDDINRERDAVLRLLGEVSNDLKLALEKPGERQKYEDAVKLAEKKQAEKEYPQYVQNLINKAAGLGADVTFVQKAYNGAIAGGGDINNKLRLVEPEVLKLINEKQAASRLKFEMASKLKDEAVTLLKQCKSKDPKFKEYHKKLEAQAVDIQRMLDTGDPDLLAVARQSIADLAQAVGEIHPDLQRPDEITFEEVEARWEELSLILGTFSGKIMRDQVIKKRLPDTYERLSKELNAAQKTARTSPPKVGMEALDKLEKPIRDALDKATKLGDTFARFEQFVRDTEDRWAGLRYVTNTAWDDIGHSDSMDAIDKYITSRLNEAQSLSKNEGGIWKAIDIVGDIENMLIDIRDSKDRRLAIQQANAKFADEQRVVRDMAREFDRLKSAFKNVTLAQAKESINAKQKNGEMTEADAKDNLLTLASLEKVASGAGKIVGPYLKLLESLPHKKIGSEPAPRMDQAKSDFEKAKKMLIEAERTAKRIAGSTITTNVNITEDLKKVQNFWLSQSRVYDEALRSLNTGLAQAIKEADATIKEKIKELDTSLNKSLQELQARIGKPQNENGITQNDFDQMSKQQTDDTERLKTQLRDDFKAIERSGTQATKLIEDMIGKFRADAFSGPFSILTDDKNKDNNSRLKAREAALQTMRQYRDDILKHPLLVKLVSDANTINKPEMVSAAGYLRAALKRIEIETLIGI